MALLEDTITALNPVLTTYDTEVTVTNPPSPYAIASYRDPGLAEAHRQSPTPHWTRLTIDVRVVSRTTAGLRRGLADVRATLSGRRIGGVIFTELETSPFMPTGTDSDRRHEAVISYRTQARTEGAIRP